MFDIAQANIKEDFLRRWWCKHYRLPPTDERLGKYTLEELSIEFLEYAIEEEFIMLNKDGTPVSMLEVNGEEIMMTDDKVWNEAELEWANQPPVEELLEKYKAEQEEYESPSLLPPHEKELLNE